MTPRLLLTALGLAALALATACPTGRPPSDDDDGGDDDDDINPYAVCQDYLACAGEMAPTEMADLLEAYGPDGSCWDQGNEVADTCGAACQAGLEDLRDLPGADACWPEDCADFATEYSEECPGVADETWCDDAWADWRECIEPHLWGCDMQDFGDCEEHVPVPDGAIYRVGTWEATWTSQDVDCDALTDADLDILPQSVAFAGDSITTLDATIWAEATLLYPLPVDCTLDGDEFTCSGQREMEGGVISQELDGRFTDVEEADASYRFSIVGKEALDTCEAEASGSLAW